MRNIIKLFTFLSFLFSISAQAGTIGYYFSQDCLSKLAYKNIPNEITFYCTKEGQCFTGDLPLKSLLSCAHPYGKAKYESESIQSYQLSAKGFK